MPPSKEPCPVCQKARCYAHCSKNAPTHEHKPDRTTASSLDADRVDDSNPRILVDFNCRFCGQNGSCYMLAADINWS
jgi:hypothetical protein